ncbi:DegT/DnrJ/EryC1/StrS family aminotransferase [Emcibacter nanhaiensis]|uniref:DegT/DnrJ/EryC1/StrS aminotransferase family protein n=1 Tax=Emcibacter nanhaiensis TaxID=1505037 RepID=A0A501PBQ1_9PROT|nr:DegT/DnrJ/EryC1/StrS aminotransferase family protein [Emcibacter nanhaiensis]TPD57406.1 DegT/DnrJ/EryC1/StrS aminotransferase family protein [Emcibacter nanhaiensis]
MSDNLLAINGGPKACPAPFSPWPLYEEDEIAAVVEVLRSGKVNYWGGTKCTALEEAFASLCNCKFGVAVANGTLALELALKAIDIQSGDEVIVPSRSFFASASAIVAAGGVPVFCDVDIDSGNLTVETIEAKLTDRTKAVIAVHLAGWPCDMDPILELANQKNLLVIEDCAQAHGALYKDRPVGGIGHIGCFSFCQDKIISTGGEGGMLVTNDKNVWNKAWSYKDHGRGYDKVFNYDHPPGFRWLCEGFGTNWRLTEMQAAIGLIQLRKLEEWVNLRRRNAAMLKECFDKFPSLKTPTPSADYFHASYKLYTYVDETHLARNWNRSEVREALRAEGLPVTDGACSEIYLENAFNGPENFRPPERLPVARRLGETALMFNVHHTLTHDEIENMCNAVRKVMEIATLKPGN